MKQIFLSILILSYSVLNGQNAAEQYIENFAPIAIEEMERTGIPASIKLAQGILESNSGQSDMAKRANNHFGIKCGSEWNGGIYLKVDDETNWLGKPIESCFRTYSDAEESFIAHSDFLTNNGKESRYLFLFKYDKDDYKNWAKGLKKAGYASDPKYAQKLIHVIEKYALFEYDLGIVNDPILAQATKKEKKASARILRPENMKAEYANSSMPDFRYYNKTKMVMANGNESMEEIAASYEVPVDILLYINDGYDSPEEIPFPKSRIYLEEKRKSYSGRKKYHQVRQGEKMEEISQHYGISLEALYIRNKIPFGSQVTAGELVQLKGLIRSGQAPELKDKKRQSLADAGRFVEETVEYIFSGRNSNKK